MFFNRLMGTSQGNRGTLYWLVEPDLCQSSTGVYYRKTGLNVYGSDGNWFSSLDAFDEQKTVEKPTSSKSTPSQSVSGCLPVLILLLVAALFFVFR